MPLSVHSFDHLSHSLLDNSVKECTVQTIGFQPRYIYILSTNQLRFQIRDIVIWVSRREPYSVRSDNIV